MYPESFYHCIKHLVGGGGTRHRVFFNIQYHMAISFSYIGPVLV